MTSHYASYLVRSWRTQDGVRRVVVEHVQSGARASVPTLDAMVERIAAWEVTPPEKATRRPGADGEQDLADEPSTRQA
jgi:hypothetical protein